MRRKPAILAIVVLLWSGPAPAQTPAQMRAAVDTWLAPRWATVQTLQAAYLVAHGKYWQGLRTHRINEPANGAEIAPDNLAAKPSDQAERWADFLTLPATMPGVLEIHTYDGPAGKGFVAYIRLKVNSVWWERSAQVGSETWRARAWHQETIAP